MPEAANEKAGGQQDNRSAQPERRAGRKPDQVEPGADRGCEQNKIQQGAMRVGEAKHVLAHGIIEDRGRTKGAKPFQKNSKCDPKCE